MTLIYSAIFHPWEDGEGYTVEIPDLPGCVSEGHSLAEAIMMATDAASGWVLTELEDGQSIPKASAPGEIVPTAEGSFVSLLSLDMDAYTEKHGKNAVRKNLTIPAWLNTFAEQQHLNFSKVLQDSLIDIYERGNDASGL